MSHLFSEIIRSYSKFLNSHQKIRFCLAIIFALMSIFFLWLINVHSVNTGIALSNLVCLIIGFTLFIITMEPTLFAYYKAPVDEIYVDNFEEGEKNRSKAQNNANYLTIFRKTIQQEIIRLDAEKGKITQKANFCFLLSILSLIIGAVVIVCSLYKVYFTDNYDLSVSVILAIAGILMEFSGICMAYFHLKNLDQLMINQEKLKKRQETMTSAQLLQDVLLPNIDNKREEEIINKFIAILMKRL